MVDFHSARPAGRSLLTLLILLCGVAAGCRTAPEPGPRRVLIITGEDYPGHRWQETTPVLRAVIAADPRLGVEIHEDLSTLHEVGLHDFDAVVVHFKNYDPEVPGRRGFDQLARYVEEGGGMVLVHFAGGAFQEFRGEYTEFAGRTWDPELRGHDPHGTFEVTVTERGHDHQITRGLEDFETIDELYTCLDGTTPITVLAEARSKVDGEHYPMAFVLDYGRGRVFHSPLGHDAAAFDSAGAAELIRRGTAWAAGLSDG